ncbi:MAG: type II toxin-antitoxin system VapC family toxin [Thermoguttaceae bacterium]|nr:type II toxin-antitoxin system VapC family toxin [Thermoguttaceae bacterium]
MKTRKPTLLLDTCVGSDFLNVDAEIVGLASKSLGELLIPRVLMEELSRKFEFDVLDALGLRVVDSSDEILKEAGVFRLKKGFRLLSENDCVCLLTALKNKYTCVTNDRLLQKTCKEHGVQVWWGVEVVLALYEQDGVSYERAENFIVRLRQTTFYVKKEHEDEYRRRLLAIKEKKTNQISDD